jgi:hypothetical protein
MFWKSHIYPFFAERTLERFKALQCIPWGGQRRRRPDSGELAGARGRARAGKGTLLPQGSIPRRGWVREGAGERGSAAPGGGGCCGEKF